VIATQKTPENSVTPLFSTMSFITSAYADSLVANVVKRIAEQFSNERAKLEEQWSKGNNLGDKSRIFMK
jgi:hypothetical protein